MKRFWEKIEKKKVGCWKWKASTRGKTGYGAFKYKGKVIDAHRFSYILHKGYIPEGFLVCHICDNRLCVNPSHLILGTSMDNYNDGVSRGKIKINTNEHLRKHPSGGAYKRGCRCNECKNIHRHSMKEWRLKKKLKSV
ncbi:HNH endonuclease signature motif containing protein [Chitinophaga sp. 22536]|uniref:HNH endonuclease signature motif containing protein n=1 Tax=unclassified Chitinophaga TaxID=2619133 RepID=UPI003F86F36B